VRVHQIHEALQPNHGLHSQNVKAKISGVLKPEVMRSSPMREENEAQHEHRHEEKVLSDHDALLLLFLLAKIRMPLCVWGRCDGRISRV
jgi:hypothetical protein